jgi:hypothetical protein
VRESDLLVKATLTHLESLEGVTVLWNPSAYRIERRNRFAAPGSAGAPHGTLQYVARVTERFLTRLFLDSTRVSGPERDLGLWIADLERWSRPERDQWLPPRLLFAWGSFRFRGHIESLAEDWERFDADGTPVRGWVDLVMRR